MRKNLEKSRIMRNFVPMKKQRSKFSALASIYSPPRFLLGGVVILGRSWIIHSFVFYRPKP